MIPAANVPAGLTAVFTRDSATQVTMTLTGRATSHADVNDASDLRVFFHRNAFAGGSFPTGRTLTGIAVDFMDAAITYTGGFAETASNDGSVSGSVVFTLWGDTFASDAVSAGLVIPAANVPAGLTAVFTRDSATQVTMTLTGRATSHADANDESDLRVFFHRNAFAGGSFPTGRTLTGIAVDFMDAAITYTGGFAETASNDGSVSGSVVMTLWGDTFTSDVLTGGAGGFVSVSGVPAGLTAAFTRDSATQLTLTLTGRASAHADADDVSDLSVGFERHAFSGGDADAVAGHPKNDLAVDFMDAAITWTGGFTETAANDGSVSGSVVFTLWGDTFTSDAVSAGLVFPATHVPAGLTAVLTRDSATQITMTLTGRATSHADADDASDREVFFHRNAFAGGSFPTGRTLTGIAVDFRDPGVLLPAQVTGVRVAPGDGELTVSWNAVTGASGYKVQWKSGTQGYDAARRQAAATTASHTIPNLAAGTAYTVRVIATFAGEEGEPAMDGPSSREARGAPNRPPVFTAGATAIRSVAENAAAGTDIGAVLAATDADGHGLTWRLGGADRASFAIVATTGQLRTKSGVVYDFETDNSYAVTVTVTDPYGGSDSIDVTIRLTDVTEAPAAPAAPTFGRTTATSLTVELAGAGQHGPDITDYDVQYRLASTAPSGGWTSHDHTGTATTATIAGLTEGGATRCRCGRATPRARAAGRRRAPRRPRPTRGRRRWSRRRLPARR